MHKTRFFLASLVLTIGCTNASPSPRSAAGALGNLEDEAGIVTPNCAQGEETRNTQIVGPNQLKKDVLRTPTPFQKPGAITPGDAHTDSPTPAK